VPFGSDLVLARLRLLCPSYIALETIDKIDRLLAYDAWAPEYNDPAGIPEHAAEHAKEVGAEAVLLTLCPLVIRGAARGVAVLAREVDAEARA